MKKQFSYRWCTAFIFLIITTLVAFSADAAQIEELIPNDSIVYLTLRDLNEIWDAASESKNWQAVFATPSVKLELDKMNQSMQVLKLMFGTDIYGLVETFGHQIALTIFPGELEPMIGVVVNTAGAIREVERIVTAATQMASADEGNRVNLQAGTYRKIQYSTAQIDDLSLTYAFVGDLFVVGVNPGSFEGLIDTYRKERESIKTNKKFRQNAKKFVDGQVFAYVNVDSALPLLTADMGNEERRKFGVLGLDTLQTLVYSLDLLNPGELHQLYAQIKPNQRKGILGTLLHEGQPVQSVNAMSGEEDLFIAVAPSSSKVIWKFIETVATAEDSSGGFYDGVATVEAYLNLDIESDIVSALTGEIAVWGNFPKKMGPPESPLDLLYELDAAIVAALKSPPKWETFLNSIQNLANLSIQQYDYKGTTLHQVSLPPDNPTITVNYGDVENLFLVSFSDRRFESVVDNAFAKGAASTIKNRIKALPAAPIFLLQLKLERLLPLIIASKEPAVQLSPNAIQQIREIEPLFTSISVKGDEVWLRVEISSKEALIETLGKLASVIFPLVVGAD